MSGVEEVLRHFMAAHRLPAAFADTARRHYLPLAEKLDHLREQLGRPLVAGIHGCQGSGKSTLATLLTAWLAQVHGRHCVALSIDDFYLTREQRRELAERVHPLFITRGVPGSHDTALLDRTLDALTLASGTVAIPRFDKTTDDRQPERDWPRVKTPVDVVILEGWCLGVKPQDPATLGTPINRLEAEEDSDGRWRQYVNNCLRTDYLPLWERIDYWIMLAAPSFDCVFEWRMEAERRLCAQGGGQHLMDETAMRRFIEHYQRLTEHALATLPPHMDQLIRLDEQRRVQSGSPPSGGR